MAPTADPPRHDARPAAGHDVRDSTLPPPRRLRRVVVAGHRGDTAVAAAHLHDPDPAVRGAALHALQRAGALDDPTLSEGLADPEPSVRRRAAELAGRHPGDAPGLVALLEDPHPLVVEAAAAALGEREPSGPAVSALCRTARDHADPSCRESAVAALGALGHPDGRATVIVACADRATVRRRAVLALAAFEGPEVTEALRRLSGDRDLQVRQAAEDLLAIEDDGRR